MIFNWDYYGRFPAKIFAVWEGGLAMHGGLIVGPLVGAVLARRWKIPILRGLDVAAPSIVIGQAIGRWGNFFNEEAFGAPTSLPWKLYISPPHRPPGFTRFEFFHPTFLYESLWDLAVFLVLIALAPGPRSSGSRGRSSSRTSVSIRWGASSSSPCGSTASGSDRSGWRSSRACSGSPWPSPGSRGPSDARPRPSRAARDPPRVG